jgi:hypothetical protein
MMYHQSSRQAIKVKKSYVAAFQDRQFSHDPSFFNSIDTSLTVSATEQNAATKQTPQYQSVAQFYRDLQAKGNFTASPEEIAEFTTEFASKNQWCFNRHKLSQRSPATRLQIIFRTDRKMTVKFWTVIVGAFAQNTWRDFVR